MRQNKSISFNMLDPYDVGLLEHAERINPLSGKKQNFSSYVKRLIADDISGVNRIAPQSYQVIEEIQTDETREAMSSFL